MFAIHVQCGRCFAQSATTATQSATAMVKTIPAAVPIVRSLDGSYRWVDHCVHMLHHHLGADGRLVAARTLRTPTPY